MTIGMFAKLDHGEVVYLEIVDLTTFVHAAPDAEVCIYDQQNQAHRVRKDALHDFKIETGEPGELDGFNSGPPHDAATATGMYDHE